MSTESNKEIIEIRRRRVVNAVTNLLAAERALEEARIEFFQCEADLRELEA